MNYDSPEAVEKRALKELLDEQRRSISNRFENVRRMAGFFFEQWVRDDSAPNTEELRHYLERAWEAAEMFHAEIDSRKPKEIEGE